jgi:hypothetical protein
MPPATVADEGFQESRMREICMSGSTRGQPAALSHWLSYSTGQSFFMRRIPPEPLPEPFKPRMGMDKGN